MDSFELAWEAGAANEWQGDGAVGGAVWSFWFVLLF